MQARALVTLALLSTSVTLAQAPTITSVTPSSMHAYESGPISIQGTSLGTATAVTVGGSSQSILQQSPTLLVFQKTSGIPGAHSLIVTGPTGSAATTFVSTPALSASTALIGDTLTVTIDPGSVGLYVLVFGLSAVASPIVLPPIHYGLLLDPGGGVTTLASGILVTSSPFALSFSVPNNPVLIGAEAHLQAWAQQGLGPNASSSFSNHASAVFDYTWISRTPLPSARTSPVAVEVGGKILAIGGAWGPGWSPGAGVDEYDPSLHTWTPRTSMPTARAYPGAGVINGRVLVVGGSGPGNAGQALEEYDPALDVWVPKASMPTPRSNAGVAVLGGVLHVIGGQMPPPIHTLLATHEVYDPSTDTWSTRAPMPTARQGLGAAVVNGRIYAIGGSVSNNTLNYTVVEEYDPITDSWATRTPMPTARSTFGCAVLNGKIYAIGGVTSGTPALDQNEEYDPVANTWAIKPPLPTPRRELGAATIGNRILTVGGDDAANGNILATVEEFKQ